MRFTGKTVYVTQANTKQGEALALRFAQEGANLVLGDACECLVKKVEEIGAKTMIVKPDLSTFEGAQAMLDEVNPGCHLEVDGGVDVVTAEICKENGADVLVAGSAFYGAADRKAVLQSIEA